MLYLSLHETRPAVAPLATLHPTTAQKDGLRSMQLVDMEIMRCTLRAIILAAGPPSCRQSAERGANPSSQACRVVSSTSCRIGDSSWMSREDPGRF